MTIGSMVLSDPIELAENYKRRPWPTAERAGSTSGYPQAKLSGFKHLVASSQTNIIIGPLEWSLQAIIRESKRHMQPEINRSIHISQFKLCICRDAARFSSPSSSTTTSHIVAMTPHQSHTETIRRRRSQSTRSFQD